MAPVILKTDVHCLRCARKIRKVLKSQYGVDDLWVSLETGLVVVAGPWLDASLLRWRIQSAMGKPVDIVSDGAAAEAPPDNGQMVHLGPPQGYGSYPLYGYGGGGAFSWVPAAHHAHRQYVPNEAPVYFNDDNPNGCCNVQ